MKRQEKPMKDAPHALKGQKRLAQGNTLGKHASNNVALQWQKLYHCHVLKLLPLQGALLKSC